MTLPGEVRAWVLACRPATLTAAVVPVLVGSACALAVDGFRVGPALAALFGALCIQVGTNLANDVFDYEKGADTIERLGPVRAVQAGLLDAAQVRAGMIVAFLLATLAGLYLWAVAGLAVVAIGIASVASGIAYTGGPFPLGYHGLGDVFVLVFFGFVAVCGTAFVEVGRVPALAWGAAIPVGTLATAILCINNLRDRDTDAKAGKNTLVVRFGVGFGRAEFAALLFAAYVVPGVLWFLGQATPWALLPLLSLPLGTRLVARVVRQRGAALNACLVDSAKLLLVYGLLWATGLSAAAFVS